MCVCVSAPHVRYIWNLCVIFFFIHLCFFFLFMLVSQQPLPQKFYTKIEEAVLHNSRCDYCSVNEVTNMNTNQGSKKHSCGSRRIFRAEPGCHFSGRIFFHLGRNHAPRLKSLGAKKEAIFEASFCTHPNTNIINEMIASSFFFWQWKSIESKKKKSRKKLGPLHSHETRRGSGRRCWVKADKKFSSGAKKGKKEKKKKQKCVYMCKQSCIPRQA